MKEFKFILLSVIIAFSASAQDTSAIKITKPRQLKKFGENAVEQRDYLSAIEYFEKYLSIKPGDADVEFKLAESYRINRDYVKAQEWYMAAYKTNPEKNIKALFYLGQMQKSNTDYKSAIENLAKFKKQYKGQDASVLKKIVDNEIAGAEAATGWINEPKKVLIDHLDTSINKIHVELSPIALDSNTLVYSSLRGNPNSQYVVEDTAAFPVRQFYTAKRSDDAWVGTGMWPALFNEPGVNIGNGAFSPSRTKFFFTKCKPNKQNKMICAIYMSVLEKGTWQEPVMLSAEINNPQYTSTQPAVGIESKKKQLVLYYVSDRPDGKGETDIWYSLYDTKSKAFKAPKNAGAKINTAGQEVTPFIDTVSNTLYFSSTGWPGMGGLDVFKANGELNKWTTPVNITAPVNSPADELYYVTLKSSEDGFLVSNRKGGVSYKSETCCDDIYYYRWVENLKYIFNGLVISDSLLNTPIKGARINVVIQDDSTKEMVTVGNFVADEEGRFKVPIVYGNNYKFLVSNPGYLNHNMELNTKGRVTPELLNKTALLKPVPAEAITLQNIYYEYGKADLTTSAKASIDTTLLKIMTDNPLIIIEIGSHTDSVGTDAANMSLSQARAESVVKYLTTQGISKERLKSKGYGESTPIAPNTNPDGTDNPVGREKNRRTEFRILGKLEPKEEDEE